MGKLSKSIILQGIDYREDVFLPAYNATVSIRPLTDIELYECREKAGILDMITKFGITGKSEAEIIKQISSDPKTEKEWIVASSRLAIEAAKRGIVDPELREMVDNPLKGQPGQPDKVMALELLRGGSLELIGYRIIEITSGDISNFTTPTKESDS